MPTILALAGRRIDADGATPPRFPLQNLEIVRQRVREHLLGYTISTLVSGAACGADLLALDEARKLGINARIVIPCERGAYKKSSVVDRPGNWGPLFDAIASELERGGNLVEQKTNKKCDNAYMQGNRLILEEALRLAKDLELSGKKGKVAAVVVWDQKSRGKDDVTAAFASLARELGITVSEISTSL